jgi:hypothetical protein
MNLYIDESGNTGADLLNVDQPLFALASTILDDEMSRALVEPLRSQTQTEAKYSKLKATASGQESLLRFLSSPVLTPENCAFMLADKRYYLITQLVDKIVEPLMHESGIDLYAGDAHVGLVNLFYYAGEHAFPEGRWNQILQALIKALRKLDAESFSQFQEVVYSALPHMDDSFYEFKHMLGLGAATIEDSLAPFRGTYSFDPAVDVFIALVQSWMRRSPGMLVVTHDQSKPLAKSEKLLRAMMSPVASRMIGYGQRKAELPLRISDLRFADSRSVPQLQVADLIAGLAVDLCLAMAGKRESTSFTEAVKDSPLPQWFVDGMLPNPDMQRRNEPSPGERNLVDGSASFMSEVGYFVGKKE